MLLFLKLVDLIIIYSEWKIKWAWWIHRWSVKRQQAVNVLILLLWVRSIRCWGLRSLVEFIVRESPSLLPSESKSLAKIVLDILVVIFHGVVWWFELLLLTNSPGCLSWGCLLKSYQALKRCNSRFSAQLLHRRGLIPRRRLISSNLLPHCIPHSLDLNLGILLHLLSLTEHLFATFFRWPNIFDRNYSLNRTSLLITFINDKVHTLLLISPILWINMQCANSICDLGSRVLQRIIELTGSVLAMRRWRFLT